MNISIIIPNYNGSELLKKNIPAVLKAIHEYRESEILIIDDASTDDSLEILESFKNEIRVIQNKTNMGFARSVNKAVRNATGAIIILLNSDVRPEVDFIKPLLAHFENHKVFAVACLDKSIENGKTVERGRGIGKWSRGFFVHNAGVLDKKPTLWASGGSSAFRKSIWEALGGFRTFYKPFYWEDIDLSYRAWKMGYEVDFEEKSIVIHEHEGGSIKKQFSPFFIKTIAYKNQFLFVWSNIRNSGYILDHLVWLPYHLIRSLMSTDFAFIFGLLKALLSVPSVIKINFIFKSKYLKSDKEILSLFKQ